MTTTTTTTATLADELRTAATRLRDTAQKATSGPWISGKPSWAGTNAVLNSDGHPVTICGDEVDGADHPASADAAWITLASPALAEPLARLLEDVSDAMETADAEERDFPDHAPDYRRMVVDDHGQDRMDWTNALRLARALNGGAA